MAGIRRSVKATEDTMRLLTTSVTALAALGLFVSASAAAGGCNWHKNQVTASAPATPAPAATAVPATATDPWLLAQLERAALVPALPKEEGQPQIK
jgi:hypothetical protein